MSQLQRIIVGHDLREGSESAVQSAAALASRYGAALRFVHVIEPVHTYQRLSHPFTPPYTPEELAQQAGAKLEALVSSPAFVSLHAEYEVRVGKPFVELIIARRAWQADLIIVGGSIDEAGPLLGGTSERVVRKALVPVLITKRPLSATTKTFLLPTDFSLASKQAAQEALTLAASFDGRVIFFHAIDLSYGYGAVVGADMPAFSPAPLLTEEDLEGEWQAFLADLPLQHISWERRTVSGPAGTSIVNQADQCQADVIVMSTHGRNGLAHMLLGSVTEEVVRTAHSLILTIRPDAFRFELPQ